MFKKTALLLLTAFSFIFASSGSMERSRFLDTEFIDIGKKDNLGNDLVTQQFVHIPAKTKLLDEIFDYKDRVYEDYTCKVDNEGGETCPKDVTECKADPTYSAGYSEKKSGVYTLTSPYVMGWINKAQSTTGHFAADHWIDALFTWNEKDKVLQMFIYGSDPSRRRVEWNVGDVNNGSTLLSLTNPNIKNGKVYISMKFWEDSCSSNSAEYVLEVDKLYKMNKILSKKEMIAFAEQANIIPLYTQYRRRWSPTTYHIPAKSSVMYGHILSLGVCGGGGAQAPYVLFEEKGELGPVCPNQFNFDKDKDKCVKAIDYVYYDYKCPANTGEINPKTGRPFPNWVGPKNKGGDCGGVGLSANMECNSANPPTDNCFRNFYYCPFDPKRPCFKNPTSNKAVAQNQQNQYLYAAGIGQTFAKILTEVPKCSDGGTFNNETKQCEIALTAQCPAGYTDTPYENTCVKKLNDPTTEKCEPGAKQANNLCYMNKTQTCPAGYIGDFKNKCYKEASCPENHILTPEGKCELKYFYTEYSCPAGYENVKPQTSINNDCKGLCGYDGCSCNSELPQADNCRKTVPIDQNTYEVSERSPMLLHKVKPSRDYKVPNENFSIINIPCSIEPNEICKDNVVSVKGENDKLCFKKANGQEFCYDVFGCNFSGTISSSTKIKDIYVTTDLQTLASKSSTGEIKSTCRLNGNVGYAERKEGITSVSPKLGSQKYVTIKAKGSATTSNGEWSGFNIANMAIQLTDGLWYTVENVYGENGDKIVRNVPNYIVGLDRSMFKIVKNNEHCLVKGVNAPGYCGDEVIVYMPNPDLGVIGVAELDALNKEVDSSKNSVNLTIFANDIKIPLTKNIDSIANNPFVVKPINAVTEYEDRLNFWDSYIDGDIGFIEFVREVAPQDKKNGFVPENKVPFEWGEKGFTNIEYSSSAEKKEENVFGTTEVLRRGAQLVTKEVEKLVTETLFWNRDSHSGPGVSGGSRNSRKVLPFIAEQVCNRVFRMASGFFLATNKTDEEYYMGPIKNVITKSDYLRSSRTTIPGFSRVDIFEVDDVIDKKIFLHKTTRLAYEEEDERKNRKSADTFYEFFKQGRTKRSSSHGGNRTWSSTYSLLLAQCFRKENVSEYVCPESYELKVLDGKQICERKIVSCPNGYFYTGKVGKDACRRNITSGTFFVSSKMPEGECSNNAKLLNGTIIPFDMLKFNLINDGKSLTNSGATREGCVIRVGHETDYQTNIYAVKTSTYDNNFQYVCSKWSCLGGKCKIGTCPTINTRIGNESKPMEYQGKIIPDSVRGQLSNDACLDQICDGNKEHAQMCGLKFQPSTELSKGVFFENGKFYQAYCDDKDAVLSDDGATCIVKRCPEGTTKQSDGTCKKK